MGRGATSAGGLRSGRDRARAARRRAGARALGVPRRGRTPHRPARAARARQRVDPGAAHMIHAIPLDEATLHGYFSPVLTSVLSVEPGDTRRSQARNARGRWEPDTDFADRDAELHNGQAPTGPIEVRGARAGQTLVVSIDEVTPRDWGVTSAHGTPFRWRIDGDT